MKESIQNRLRQIAERREEIALLLAEPNAFSAPERFRNLSRELAQIAPLVEAWER